MDAIYTLLFALPFGLIVLPRARAMLVYIIGLSFVFTFQTLILTLQWVGGATTAFGKPDESMINENTIGYAVVNAIIALVGLGLVTLGNWARTGRHARTNTVSVHSPVAK